MSTRVFNPYVMSGKRGGGHFDFGGSERHASVERAKRKLFGPVDHAEAKLFAEKELEALQEKAAQKWNFDFKSGKPRTTPDDTGYKWVKFSATEEIPKAYDLKGCEYLHLHADIAGKDNADEVDSLDCPSSSSSTIKQCNKQSVITGDLVRSRYADRVFEKNVPKSVAVIDEDDVSVVDVSSSNITVSGSLNGVGAPHFMKPSKRTNLNSAKSSSLSSVTQDEPAPKKARARSS